MGVVARFLQRFRPPPVPSTPRYRDMLARIDELEADVEHLHTLYKKILGRQTGGIRRRDETEAPASNGKPHHATYAQLMELRRRHAVLPG